jgi:hypothetical protein
MWAFARFAVEFGWGAVTSGSGRGRYQVPDDGTQRAGAGSDDGRHSRLSSP